MRVLRRSPAGPLVLLFALGLAPRLWDLGRRGLSNDELVAVAVAAQDPTGLGPALAYERNMWLYYLAMFAWVQLVGSLADEAVLRLPAAVLGAAGVSLIRVVGSRLLGAPAGLAAALLLAFNGYHVLWSREARGYTALADLVLIAYLLLDRALQTGRARDWALHGLANGLAFYCHFFAVFGMLGQALGAIRRSRGVLVGLAVSGLVTALLTLPMVALLPPGFAQNLLAQYSPPTARDLLELGEAYSGGTPWLLGLYAVLIAAGVAGLRRAPRGHARLLLTWLLVPPVLILGIAQVRPIYNERYLFMSLPALVLVAGAGLAHLPRALGGAALTAAIALSLVSLQGGGFEINRGPTADWRQAVSHAQANARPGDGWIFIAKWGQHAFDYYAGWGWGRNPAAPYRDVLEPYDFQRGRTYRRAGRGAPTTEALEAFAEGRRRIWLVLYHESDPIQGDTAAPTRDWLSRHGYAATQRQLRGVRVILYERRDGSG